MLIHQKIAGVRSRVNTINSGYFVRPYFSLPKLPLQAHERIALRAVLKALLSVAAQQDRLGDLLVDALTRSSRPPPV
jgi:hypothetical protein